MVTAARVLDCSDIYRYLGKPMDEVLGPALLCLARQTGDTLTGQILHTREYGKTWHE